MNTAPLVIAIPVEQLSESPDNPRKLFGDMTDLTASIAKSGVLQPILARPLGSRNGAAYEIVFGHRRFRAAKAAGQSMVPVMVRELEDLEALEMQLVENAQREDIHPLEEAEGYRILHETHDCTIDAIAAKVGKSVSSVYARMKLNGLCPEAKEAFYAGQLTPSTALIVARIPSAKLQVEALKAIGGDEHLDAMSAREASEHVQQKFMLRLAEAPFNTTAVNLVKGVGACTTCPKRTGNQADLFADVKSADVCTDLDCFGKKRDAEWKRRAAQAKETEQTVIEGKEAKKLFPHGGYLTYDTGFVELDVPNGSDPKRRTWRQLLKKALPETTLVRDSEGGIHELVKETAAKSAAKKAGHNFDVNPPGGLSKQEKEARKKEDERRMRARADAVKARQAVLEQIAEAVGKKKPSIELWRKLVLSLFKSNWYDAGEDVLARRGIPLDHEHPIAHSSDKLLAGLVEEMDHTELLVLIFEGAALEDPAFLAEAAEAYGIALPKSLAPELR
jgi:ParB/RepB/Spo0J family partition protein